MVLYFGGDSVHSLREEQGGCRFLGIVLFFHPRRPLTHLQSPATTSGRADVLKGDTQVCLPEDVCQSACQGFVLKCAVGDISCSAENV